MTTIDGRESQGKSNSRISNPKNCNGGMNKQFFETINANLAKQSIQSCTKTPEPLFDLAQN